MYTPHNFFEAPKDEATPTPQPHQDEAAELARADRSPAAAFIGLALALTSLALLWFGRTLLVPALCVAVAAILVSVLAWRQAHRRRRPIGVGVAALAVALITLAIVAVLWT
jgi:predicted PurR-regulated permease PerM